jgi:hypothetical protein
MSKSVGTGPSSYEKIIYRAAVSQRLRNTAVGLLLVDGAVYNIGNKIYLSGLSVLLVVVTNITAKYSS